MSTLGWRATGAAVAVLLASAVLWLRQTDDALLGTASYAGAFANILFWAAPTILLYVLLVRSAAASLVAGLLLGALLVWTWWRAATDWHSTAALGPGLMGWFLGPAVVLAAVLADRAESCNQLYEMRGLEVNADSVEEATVALRTSTRRVNGDGAMSELTMVAWDDGAEQHEAPLEEADLEELVSKLDGRTRTLVTLFVGEGHAACGGDARAGLVTHVTLDGERFHQLVRGNEDGEGEVGVVAGGQLGQYPARSVVSADRAIEVLRWYADHHELMPWAEWESS